MRDSGANTERTWTFHAQRNEFMTITTSIASEAIRITGRRMPRFAEILTPDAVDFIAKLHRHAATSRQRLLARRRDRQAELDAGRMLDFLPETRHIREAAWKVAPVPADLQDRRVEITGPTDRKMMINALNSGASVFMADFEDANSPTWENLVEGQANLCAAARNTSCPTAPE
jgi:malate synthase